MLLGGASFEECIIQDDGDDIELDQQTQYVNQPEKAMVQIMQTQLQIKVDQQSLGVKKCKDEMIKGQADIEMAECNIEEDPSSEVILFIDNREKRNQQDGNYLFDRLSKNGIKIELKSLPLGDFLWVLRVKHSAQQNLMTQLGQKSKGTKKKVANVATHTDYVLDFIVERKTADDLAASIMDGRYEEQKYRLKTCGINNVVYLVEGSPGQYCKIPEVVLKKAQIHT